MGQAAYDALREHFLRTSFYNEDSISPFMVESPRDIAIIRLEMKDPKDFEPEKPIQEIKQHSDEVLKSAKTIEEIEDHYFGKTECVSGYHGKLSIFSVNGRASSYTRVARRGTLWVVMCHPKTWEYIRDSSPVQAWENIFPPEEQRIIGRWRLVANKSDRLHHYWTSEHLPIGQIVLAYRNVEGRPFDSIAVKRTDDGYLFVEDAVPGYISREQYEL